MSTEFSAPEALFDFLQLQQAGGLSALPPVEQWQPPLSGDMDMRIARDGTWFYQGSAIRREAMVKLFSSILKREQDDYFLVTPVEKWRIEVEDAPFIIVDYRLEQARSGQSRLAGQAVVFKTHVEDEVLLAPENPLWVEAAGSPAAPRPYVRVRGGLNGLIHRNIYYRLVELALEQAGADRVGIWSSGHFFSLAEADCRPASVL